VTAARGDDTSPPTLADLPKGSRARVVSCAGRDGVIQRLLEMGLTEGVEVEVLRFAPLGDPIEIRLRGYALSLRREDARCVHCLPT
jgi:ferrous iron transport protein A